MLFKNIYDFYLKILVHFDKIFLFKNIDHFIYDFIFVLYLISI